MAFTGIPYDANTWYKIDILMDWDSEHAAFFIDGEYMANTLFFSQERDKQKKCDKSFANALMLYTLTPGETSAFKDIRMCNELCPGTQLSDYPLQNEVALKPTEDVSSEVLVDPFIVLTYSVSASMHNISASAVALLSTLSLLFSLS